MSPRKTVPKRRPGNRKPSSVRHAGLFADLPELKVARALWQENKLLESCRAFEKVVASYPANIPALIDTSRALGRLYRHQEAEQYLERVSEVGIRSGKANYLAGQSYRLIRRPKNAIACLQKALEIDGNLSDAHLELAVILERGNELDQALQHVQARLGLLANDAESLFLQGRILRRQHELDSALETLNQVANSQNSHWMTRSRAFAELARTHEQMQNFDQAWQSMLAGKELTRPYATVQLRKRTRVLPNLMRLADQVSKRDLNAWRMAISKSEERQPALLTGIPRSGTTLLGKELGEHRLVCFADEFNVFPHIGFPMLLGETPPEDLTVEILDHMPLPKIKMVAESYLKMFASAVPASAKTPVLLDKNPSLLPLLVPYLRVFPHAKMIIAIRDPRDTLVSCLMTYMPLNDFSVDMLDLESAVGRLEAEMVTWDRLKQQLPSDSWLEVKYEDVVADCRGQLADVEQFLELKEEGAQLAASPAESGSQAVFSPSYAEVAEPVSSQRVGRWVNFRKQLENHLNRLEAILPT